MGQAKWLEIRRSGAFDVIAERYRITPMLSRLLINRGVTEENIEEYLYGTTLFDPHQMKDLDLAAEILEEKIRAGKKIRIIGDYDIDGINATYILLRGVRRLSGDCDTVLPDRERDGYGLNLSMIEQAAADGIDTIVTCDNGISAAEEVRRGKDLRLTMIVTDHHDIPYEEDEAGRHYRLPPADAVVNPKRADCAYPYKGLCGAVVAWKLITALYARFDIPEEEAEVFHENAAFATIGDVMDLTGENRTIVREGLKRLRRTNNYGMKALIMQSGLVPEDIRAYHVGFILGPCINASGRLDTAERSLALLTAENEGEAARIAGELISLNESRKELTRQGVKAAEELIERDELTQFPVLVVFLPECHESLAGIIAGRLRERFYRPTIVLTRSEEGLVKGSGRSIPEYSMYEELTRVKDLFLKYGGHPMAAGLTMREEDVPELRSRLNENCALTEEDLTEKIKFDMVLPFRFVSEQLVSELSLLEPFGKENPRPLFAVRNVQIRSHRVFGKNRNVIKLDLEEGGVRLEGLFFGEPEDFFSRAAIERPVSLIYYPRINEYNGKRTLQVVINDLREAT